MYIDPALFTVDPAKLPNIVTPTSLLSYPIKGGSVFLFGGKGVSIQAHSHSDGQHHTVGVMAGSVNYSTYAADGSVLTSQQYDAPAIIFVAPDTTHSVTAVNDPVVQPGDVNNAASLSAITVHVRMLNIDPASIAPRLQALHADAASLLTSVQAIHDLTA